VITESTTLDRSGPASAERTPRRTVVWAALAVAAALVVGVLVGLNWPDAATTSSSESQAAPIETGAVVAADDNFVRYLARVHNAATPASGAAPADDNLVRYLARVHNAPIPASGAMAPADDNLVRYLGRVHNAPTPVSGAAPAEDYLVRYLARVHNAPTPVSGAAPAEDYLARYLARHQADADS
jgi:hypothetical protein